MNIRPTPKEAETMLALEHDQLHGGDGRFLPRFCGDANCDGRLVADFREGWLGGPREPIARCDGLTHLTDDGPLFACPTWFVRALAQVSP